MKKGHIVVGILVVIDLVATSAFVALMPDQIPVHFGISGEVNRIGSKYESFIIPAVGLGFGVFLALMSEYGEPSNRKVVLRLNIAMQVFFIGMGVFVFWNALLYNGTAPSSEAVDFRTTNITAIGAGILMIVLGNVMPKTTRNSTFGIRLPWTMDSDEAWQKSQRFGGYVSVVAGILIVVCGLLFGGSSAFIAMTAVFTAWALVSIVGSYFVCMNE